MDYGNVTAGFFLTVTAGFGVYIHWKILTMIGKIPALKNAFGTLTKSQSLAEFWGLSIFAFWFGPTVMWNLEFAKPLEVSSIFGHMQLVSYDVCMYSHLVIAVNRVAAICFPMQYSFLFTQRNTMIMAYACWVVAIVPSIFTFIVADCKMYYTDERWNYKFYETSICFFIIDQYLAKRYYVVVVVMVILDTITFIKVRVSSRMLADSVNAESQNRRRQDEINFFIQACLQGFAYIVELLLNLFLVNYVEGRLLQFFMSTYSWAAMHAVDGLITILFNKGFAEQFRAKAVKINSISVQQGNTHYVNQELQHPVSRLGGRRDDLPHVVVIL